MTNLDPVDDNTPQEPGDYRIQRLEVVGNSIIAHTNIGLVTCYRAAGNIWIPRRGGVAYDTDPSTPDDPPPVDPGTGTPGTVYAAIDDYPFPNQAIGTPDPWAFFARECVSFTCWRVRKRTRHASFTNHYRGVRWGNANTWDNAARSVGIRVDGTPAVHSIAVRNTGKYGHVAYVRQVHSDGSFDTEEYNSLNDHIYHQYNPTSSGRFDSFIHFEDPA